MTPDAHMVETLRLRTAALHRVIGSNDLLRRENDDLRAALIRVRALTEGFCVCGDYGCTETALVEAVRDAIGNAP